MGLADNGDFPKVLGRINAWPTKNQEGQKFDYLVTNYTIDPGHYWDSQLPTFELPLARLAEAMAALFLAKGRFDLRILGAIHAFILITAVGLLTRALRGCPWTWSLALASFTVLVFADREYLQFLNCALMDSSAIMLLVLLFSVGLIAAQKQPSWLWIVAFNLCAASFLSTKLQHQLSTIPLLSFCFYSGWRAANQRARFVWFSGMVLILGTSIWMIRHRLPDYQAESKFSLVFLKLLPLSQSPQQALKELGRPESDIQYMGMHAWSPGSPLEDSRYRDNFWRDVSTWKIVKFYRHHPGIATAILRHDLVKAGSDIPVSEVPVGLESRTIRTYGVFRKSDGLQANWWLQRLNPWSDVRRFLAVKIPVLIPALYLFCMALGVYRLGRQPVQGAWPLLLLTCAMGILSYLAGSLGDATDTSRHIVTYQVATDLMILFLFYEKSWKATAPR